VHEWAAGHIKPVPIQSISGGTDIVGCFVLGNPTLPVFAGESQCVSLGLDVQVAQAGGFSRTGTGELVCRRPFPSRPLGFHGDEGGRRFHEAYFAQNPGAWTHGDILELTDRGTARVLGRSDGVLNVRGVRIGPAEISRIVLDQPGVRQAMAVEQRDPREPGGSRIVLLVVMAPGIVLDRPLTLQLKRDIKSRGSASHVPAVIAAVSGLPTTFSGKLSERAATDTLNGVPVTNFSALRNPEVLAEIATHPALQVAK
jgi:acetoacetyl-CoA synthetase